MIIVALSLIQRPDGAILAAWNRKHSGWSLPGGKCETGETLESAQARELFEETSLRTVGGKLAYTAPSEHDTEVLVNVFAVRVIGDVVPRELNTPVGWMSKENFLDYSFAPKWHEEMFRKC